MTRSERILFNSLSQNKCTGSTTEEVDEVKSREMNIRNSSGRSKFLMLYLLVNIDFMPQSTRPGRKVRFGKGQVFDFTPQRNDNHIYIP